MKQQGQSKKQAEKKTKRSFDSETREKPWENF